MLLIARTRHDRIAFKFGARSGFRATREVIDRLQAQLWAERAQHLFELAQKNKELAVALRELAEARLELARRMRMKTFALAPSPSASLH